MAEHLIKIHDVLSSNEVGTIIKKYVDDGFEISKVESIDDKKYTFYLKGNMSYYLFLDDERMPSNVTWVNLPENVDWTIVRSYTQFVETILQKGLPKFISFDHDLADEHYIQSIMLNEKIGMFEYNSVEEKTGYDCAKWLVEYCMQKGIDVPPYTVHSMSIVGRENIINYLENYKQWKTNSN